MGNCGGASLVLTSERTEGRKREQHSVSTDFQVKAFKVISTNLKFKCTPSWPILLVSILVFFNEYNSLSKISFYFEKWISVKDSWFETMEAANHISKLRTVTQNWHNIQTLTLNQKKKKLWKYLKIEYPLEKTEKWVLLPW